MVLEKLDEVKDLLSGDLSASEIRAVIEILESKEFRVSLRGHIADPTANADRREDALLLLNALIRACRNRREQLDELKEGIVTYKNGGGLTLVGTGLGALISGLPVGIVPIGAGFYLLVTAEAARRQVAREMSALADLSDVLREVKGIVDAH